jgi:hypothetical protein
MGPILETHTLIVQRFPNRIGIIEAFLTSGLVAFRDKHIHFSIR